MNKEVILIGGFSEIIELCENVEMIIVGIVDTEVKFDSTKLKLIGTDNDIDLWKSEYLNCPLVLSPDSPKVRELLYELYNRNGFSFEKLISRKANLSKSSIIGNGVVIQDGVNISSKVRIGNFIKINTNANIMHNTVVDDYSTIAPNAVLLGYVKIGKRCYIGANSTILPNIEICDNVTIGAGAVVTRSINVPYSVYAGIPAKRIK
jgi:sugar O-acyltransferase (sialic acid O-acetyltransferase NeuD family)